MLSERVICRLVETLASRLCGWCSEECIRDGLEGRGACRHIVRDAMLAVLASYAWLPPPSLDAEPRKVLVWASYALYYSSVSPLLASRRVSSLIGSRGLFTRRLVEKLLHDYALVTGVVAYATDYRLPGGWVTYPALAKCPGGGGVTEVEATGQLSMRLRHRCGGSSIEVELKPPDLSSCGSILESLRRVAEQGC